MMENYGRKLLLAVVCLFSLVFSYGQRGNFQFAWLTDIHVVRGSNHIEDLQASVDNINKNKDVQFTIISGDISDFGYDVDLKIAKRILDKLKKPYYIVPGNHDTKWSESGATVFQEVFGHRNIAFDYGNISFIGFQTGPILRRGDGYITPDDFNWVKKEVSKARKKNHIIIPFTHYPLNNSMSNWYKLSDYFKENKVPVVLVGHGHRNRKMDFDGLPGVMARTNPGRKSKDKDTPVGYTIVKVTSDSIYFTEVNPEIDKRTLWHQLSVKPMDYITTKHVVDLSINNKFTNVKPVWKLQVSGGISAAAACDKGKVMVGDRAGLMHCFELISGKELWKFKTGKSIFSAPAIDGDKMVFGSADGFIYCLSTQSGKLLWKFKANKWVLGNPVIEDGTVLIGASDGKFRALDLQTGKLLWAYGDMKGWIETKPVVYDGKVYFGCWDNYFYALDVKTGTLIWKWALYESDAVSAFYAPAACWPVAANGKVFIAGPDQILTALDAGTGKELWRSKNQPRINEALGISADGSKVYVKAQKGDMLFAYSTNTATPTINWQTPVENSADDNQSAILEKDGHAFFTFRDGVAVSAQSNTGDITWEYKLGDVMLNPATPVDNGRVILSDVDGNIVLLKFD